MTFENLISLAESSRLLPGNPSPATIWRWRTRGVRGIKLQTWQIGGRVYTSREALQAFVEATTTAALATSDGTGERSPALQRELESAGIV